MRVTTMSCAGFLMVSLLAPPAEAQSSGTTDAILNVIGAVAANRSDRGYNRGYLENGYYGNSYYGNGGYGYDGYGNAYPGSYSGYSNYHGSYGQARPLGYRTIRRNPYGRYN